MDANIKPTKIPRALNKTPKNPWTKNSPSPQPVAAILPSDWAEKHKVFWHQSEVRTAATVWNWSGKTLSSEALLAILHFSFVAYFSARLDFPSPPLSAPGSPRMSRAKTVGLRGGQLNATRSIVASKKIMKNSRSCCKV